MIIQTQFKKLNTKNVQASDNNLIESYIQTTKLVIIYKMTKAVQIIV